MSAATGTARADGGPARIDKLRGSIDLLDRKIVALLAERTRVVLELTQHKRDEEAVRSPDRVEQVVSRVRDIAGEEGMEPVIVEATYRTLIAELTDLQLRLLTERRAAAARGSAGGRAGPTSPAEGAG
ncbi:chorismate mutase [Streptomyces sp. NBC_01754]|uniref:chorismate mutase n=1 Tax=Streptomyces sp. NBC_01754 TaxID=2975930 RepID=UPI002DD83656|nr:chorismate mutase [Streptomyces sp. NBC_01754]WSC93604.1 chorismate mutase [Streptomyces sp. NBC_01754]